MEALMTTSKLPLFAIIVLFILGPAEGRSQTAGPARFEAASVKRSDGGRRSISVGQGRISFTNVTLIDCLAAAYEVERYQVKGPDWLDREKYVILATAGSPASEAELKQMLRALLADRFSLQLHREQHDLPVYLVKVGASPLRLKPVEVREGVIPVSGGMTFQGLTMTEFAEEFLSRLPAVDRPVIDRTALQGRFTFTLRIFDAEPGGGDLKNAVAAGGIELFTQALNTVGLVLTTEKIPADLLVVDRANIVPTEN
jgi:uncharacterized protein (TIGR03435 family)